MTGKTHDLAAFTALTLVFVSVPVVPPMSLATAVVAFGANFVGGLFPDIDQKTSDMWDNFRLGHVVADFLVPILGGHRNISHSIFGLLLIGWLSDLLLRLIGTIVLIDMNIIWYSFMIGVVSNLITDLPTKAGLPLLWPLQWNFGLPPLRAWRFESGKFVEHVIIFPSLVLFTGYLLYAHQDRVWAFISQYWH